MKTIILAAAALAGCAISDPDHAGESGAVSNVGQTITTNHLDRATGEVLDAFAIEEDYEAPGGPDDRIFAAFKPQNGAFVVVGRVDRTKDATIVRGAYVDVFWRAPSDAGAGRYECQLSRNGVYIESEELGGQFWPNIDPDSHCTIDVAEVGAVGEPMRGTWTAVLLQKNGTELGTLESFAGTFDALRDEDSIDPED